MTNHPTGTWIALADNRLPADLDVTAHAVLLADARGAFLGQYAHRRESGDSVLWELVGGDGEWETRLAHAPPAWFLVVPATPVPYIEADGGRWVTDGAVLVREGSPLPPPRYPGWQTDAPAGAIAAFLRRLRSDGPLLEFGEAQTSGGFSFRLCARRRLSTRYTEHWPAGSVYRATSDDPESPILVEHDGMVIGVVMPLQGAVVNSYPLAFSPPMIVALRAGRKTVTRRLATPKWTVGDELWVKERLERRPPTGPDAADLPEMAHYVDGAPVVHKGVAMPWPWKPRVLGAMYCPRWASRTTLRVVDVRQERLHEIDDADAVREGVANRDEYAALWDRLNGKSAPWAANPIVWRTAFEVVS